MPERLERYVLSVIGDPPRPGVAADVTRGFLGGCARLYDIGLEAYLTAETVGLRRRGHLPLPVVSIGNLSVGGTGKTPMTQWLCRRLQADGKRVAVLSRGHGGETRGVGVVSDDAGRVHLDAARAGDEPVLLARTLPGVPVLVGKDRRLSGREALRRFGLGAVVLDDGFQFWQLARDLDIVLLDARRPFDNGFPLPRGRLREPERHLRRAGVVVATRAGGLTAGGRAALAAQARVLAPNAPLFFADHRGVGFVPASDLAAPLLPLDALAGQAVHAVSAIAQPDSFRRTLEREAGARVLSLRAWGDHHRFSAEEARAVLRDAAVAGAAALVMTEKDAVKWPVGEGPGTDAAVVPVLALRIEMAFEDEAGFWASVISRLG